MEMKYLIELSEQQLRLIADCVEDCHRFMSGQMDMSNTVARLDCFKDLKFELGKLKHYVTPDLPDSDYKWNGGLCPNEPQRKFIAQTYPIYREIRHFFALKNNDWANVYMSNTMTCKEGGEPIKIKEVEEVIPNPNPSPIMEKEEKPTEGKLIVKYGIMSNLWQVEAEDKLTAYAAILISQGANARFVVIFNEELEADNWTFSKDLIKRIGEIFGGSETDYENYLKSHKEEIQRALHTIKKLV
jgi:hypothetical protein